MDGRVKVWNVNEEDSGKREVSLAVSRHLGVVSRNGKSYANKRNQSLTIIPLISLLFLLMKQGKVFTVGFSPDSPLTLAAAGSAAKVQIWDIGATNSARTVFGPKLRAAGRELRERPAGNGGIIGVEDDDEDSDEE